MTREHKIALILGFGLVLLASIVLSDHFSHASRARLEAGVAGGGAENVAVRPEAVALPPLPSGADGLAPAPTIEHAGLQGPDTDNPFEPVEIITDEHLGGSPDLAPGHIPGTEPVDGIGRLAQNDAPGHAAGTPTGGPDANTSVFRPRGTLPEPMARTDQVPGPRGIPPTPTPTPGDATAAATQLPVSTGKLRRHPVQPNESIYALAVRYYGDGQLWKALAEYNGSRVGAGGALRRGVTLLIPPKDVLLGKATLPPDALVQGPDAPRTTVVRDRATPPRIEPAARRDAPRESARTAPGASAPRSYTVKPGDTLDKIASAQLGTKARWKEIVALNPGVSPTTLRVGQKIALPAR